MNQPTLILNSSIAKANISKMKAFCEAHKMTFRPHFKTHQSAEIGDWFKEEEINKCTVSSLSMASYFAHSGWDDICVALPFNVNEIEKATELAKEIKLHLCVDHPDSLNVLEEKQDCVIHIFIEIDTGYGRSGVHYKDTMLIQKLIEDIESSNHLEFTGFLSHTGNSYQSLNKEEGKLIFENARASLEELKQKYRPKFPNSILSMGDTPSSTFVDKFDGVDEWRPGNFIFYDFMQYALGSCVANEIALKMDCPIIGIYPDRSEIVIYGGGVHLSKDAIKYQNQTIYGWAMKERDSIGQGFPIVSLSQEHGIIKVTPEFLSTVKIGDSFEIIPIHSCMTADLNAKYHTERDDEILKFRTFS